MLVDPGAGKVCPGVVLWYFVSIEMSWVPQMLVPQHRNGGQEVEIDSNSNCVHSRGFYRQAHGLSCPVNMSVPTNPWCDLNWKHRTQHWQTPLQTCKQKVGKFRARRRTRFICTVWATNHTTLLFDLRRSLIEFRMSDEQKMIARLRNSIVYTRMKQWKSNLQLLPKWPFDSPNGRHLTFEKGHFFNSQMGHSEEPGSWFENHIAHCVFHEGRTGPHL